MRSALKNISIGPVKFIPESHAKDQSLSENAPDIKNRPLVFFVKKLTREDRLNIRGLVETDSREVEGQTLDVAVNIGSVARYIWENCVIEVKNVLLEDSEHESLKGKAKDDLFNTEGIDLEIMECIKFVQDISSLSEAEAKN